MTISKNILAVAVSALVPSIAIAANEDLNQQYAVGSSNPYYQGSQTQELENKKSSTQSYLAVKAGIENAEKDKSPEFDSAIQMGIYGGITFDNNFGVEVEHTMTTDTDVTSKNMGKGQYDVSSYSAFVTYKHDLSDALYLKSKVGIGSTDFTETYKNNDTSMQDVGVSGGMRLGYDITSNIAIEGEYSLFNSKRIGTDGLTLGAVMNF